MGGEGGKGEKNYIMPHNEKFKPLKSGFEENSNFKNSRDPCLKYPPEVRVQHETYNTVCGTPVQVILDQYTPLAVKICFLLWKFQLKIFIY